jgi:ATP-dependent DNA helicase RecG
LLGGELIAIIVQPSDAPPVRFKGQVWIRTGPRRGIATAEEERRLTEKRRFRDLPHDLHPLASASVDDLDLELFSRVYLPAALPPDVLEDNDRSLQQQLMSLRFTSNQAPYHPTVVGLLIVGKTPADFIPGAYVQFLRIEGTELTDPINNEHELHGPAIDVLRRLDDLLEVNISTAVDITSESTEIRSADYPLAALQQLVRNAIMHRDYQTTTAPVRITWFDDRIEIQNPGGPFGQVTCENFGQPGITDYRNPHLAEAMKNLGYVQRFGFGIQLARKALSKNGNPDPQFVVEPNYVLVIVRSRA